MPVKLDLLEYGWQAFAQQSLGPGSRRNDQLSPRDAYIAGARAAFGIVCLAVMQGGDAEDVMRVFESLDAELGLDEEAERRHVAGATA